MKQIALAFVLSLSILNLACNSENTTETPQSPPDEIHLSDLIAVDQIDSVRMNNNSGSHLIEASKLEDFKTKFGALIFDASYDGAAYKMGGISFSIYIGGNAYFFSGRTKGEVIETTIEVISKNTSWVDNTWVYFKTNGFNLDNY